MIISGPLQISPEKGLLSGFWKEKVSHDGWIRGGGGGGGEEDYII